MRRFVLALQTVHDRCRPSAWCPDASVGAQAADPAADRPGRDPRQPIDSAYTRKIHEYTTESFFLSPLVDYLPASKTVPTPQAALGDIAGSPNKLPYSKEVYDYMRSLAAASPRVRVYSIGTTEEGREMIAVAVASEALFAKLDQNKANLAKLADPRTINMDDAEAERLAETTAPVYYITGTIHSTEAGAPTALMELAYRLAVDESPYVRNIRDHLITLITPIVEVDGRDRMVDLYNWHVKHPGETAPGLIYWGHYVAHDNNRDAMGLTLKLSQNVLDTYLGWNAQVLHDLHESVAYLYDNTIGDGPYNAWLDPLLTNEWQMIGWNNVQEMTRFGMPGVFAHGDFDTWSPGYLMFMAATHNGISRLYETFGNGGTAETMDRTLSPSETERTWFKQDPPLPRVKWSMRDNNNYEETGLLVSLSYFANNRRQFLRNFYEKAKRSIAKPHTEGPAAYVLPANDLAPWGAGRTAARAAEAARRDFPRHRTVQRHDARPARDAWRRARRAGWWRRHRGGWARCRRTCRRHRRDARGRGNSRPAATSSGWTSRIRALPMRCSTTSTGARPIRRSIRTTTPAGRSPKDLRCRRCGWSMPRSSTLRWSASTGEVRARGGVSGSGAVFAINHDGDNALATLRYRFKDADFQAAEEPFEADGVKFNRGSFLIRGVAAADLDKAAAELGVQVHALAAAPTGEDASAPRGARRHHAHLGRNADRRLVAAGVRPAAHPLRLHQRAGRGEERRSQHQVRRHHLRTGQRRHAGHHRRHADVAQSDAVEEFAGNAQHRHLGPDRRHSTGPGLRRRAAPA